ncbi:MAG: M2 family metallopeptidase [Planctomycetes bacterium]|nr:M2 family metallopeptidase [Planctomycetota bacterium]
MERSIVDFIQTHVTEATPVQRDYALALWEWRGNGTLGAEKDFSAARDALHAIYARRDAYARVRSYDHEEISARATTRRQIRILRLRFANNQVAAATIERTQELEERILRRLATWRARVRGAPTPRSEARALLSSHSRDAAAREEAWRSLREAGTESSADLLRLVGIRNRAARDLEYSSWFSLTLDRLEIVEADLLRLVGGVLQSTEVAFKEIRDRLDDEARSRGLDAGRPWNYPEPFFASIPLERDADFDRYYERQDPLVLAQVLLGGMGLDVSDLLSRGTFKRGSQADGPSLIVDIDRCGDDVRVATHCERDENSMTKVIRALARGLYHRHIDPDLPWLLREPTNGIFMEAVASLLAGILRSPEFLTEILGANKSAVTRVLKRLREAHRRDTVVRMRFAAMMILFERELYRDPGADVDRIWCELTARFQGADAQEQRHPAQAWASLPELTREPGIWARRLLGELASAQLATAIREKTGQDIAPGAKDAGQFLIKEIFRSGARHHWNDLLQRATGSRLDPSRVLSGLIN